MIKPLLTREIVTQQDALSNLSEEQINAVVTLGNNLFTKEMNESTGVWHRRLEEDVKALYEISDKPPGMKSYEFLKHAKAEFDKKMQAKLEEAASKGGDLQKVKAEYESKIQNLESKLKNAAEEGSTLLKKDIEAYQQRVKDLTAQIDEVKRLGLVERKKLEGQIKDKEKENLLLEVGYERASSLNGVEFDSYIGEDVQKTFINSTWENLLNTATPERVEVDGKMITQWRGKKDGQLIYDKKNLASLATTKSLMMEGLQPILKKGRQQNGAGTRGGAGGGGNIVDLRGAKSQVQADEIITEFLIANGVTKGTQDFADQHLKIRTENNVTALPINA